MTQRWCAYCRCHKADVGFKFVLHLASNSRRAQCPSCQANRKLPRETLNQMAREERAERNRRASELAREALERKRKEPPNGP